MLESLTINKSSKLYRFLAYKIPHPEWRPLDSEVLSEALIFYVTYPDANFPLIFENKIIEEITLAIIYLKGAEASRLFVQLRTVVLSHSQCPVKGEQFLFRLKKATLGALAAAENCIEC